MRRESEAVTKLVNSPVSIEVMKLLVKMLQMSEKKTWLAMDLMLYNAFYNYTRENFNTSFSATAKKLQESIHERSPLKEVNL